MALISFCITKCVSVCYHFPSAWRTFASIFWSEILLLIHLLGFLLSITLFKTNLLKDTWSGCKILDWSFYICFISIYFSDLQGFSWVVVIHNSYFHHLIRNVSFFPSGFFVILSLFFSTFTVISPSIIFLMINIFQHF